MLQRHLVIINVCKSYMEQLIFLTTATADTFWSSRLCRVLIRSLYCMCLSCIRSLYFVLTYLQLCDYNCVILCYPHCPCQKLYSRPIYLLLRNLRYSYEYLFLAQTIFGKVFFEYSFKINFWTLHSSLDIKYKV